MIENESEVLVCLSLLQRGTSLLRRKEEQLQQLESSIAEEVRRTSASVATGIFFPSFN